MAEADNGEEEVEVRTSKIQAEFHLVIAGKQATFLIRFVGRFCKLGKKTLISDVTTHNYEYLGKKGISVKGILKTRLLLYHFQFCV